MPAPKKGSTKKPANKNSRSHPLKATIERDLAYTRHARHTISVVLFVFAVFFFILVFFPGVHRGLHQILGGLFGGMLTSLFWLILLIGIIALLTIRDPGEKVGGDVTRGVVIMLAMSSFLYTVTIAEHCDEMDFIPAVAEIYGLGAGGQGTGVTGIFGYLLTAMMGKQLAIVVIVLISVMFAMLLFNVGFVDIFIWIWGFIKSVGDLISSVFMGSRYGDYDDEDDDPEEEPLPPPEEKTSRRRRARQDSDIYPEDTNKVPPAHPAFESNKRPKRNSKIKIIDSPAQTPGHSSKNPRGRQFYILPPNEDNSQFTIHNSQLDDMGGDVASVGVDALIDLQQGKVPLLEGDVSEADRGSNPPEDPLDELTRIAAEKKSKRQKAAEIAAAAEVFKREVDTAEREPEEYKFPPISLLSQPEYGDDSDIQTELKHNAERLVAVLDEYGVDVSVINISQGPAITRYELKPAPGVKISKITSLTNDIALRLAAKAVRIEAPIPGKPAVGVEIPNQHVSTVKVRELINSEAFREAQSPVTVSVGKDIEGNIVLGDLSKMPHLLVAGSTGSGKSVCINSMLISLIYKSSPEDLRLIMVDPKAVEMDIYNGIPHLLVPVVCDPKKAAGALQWAVNEMLKRYAILKEKGVRNLEGYNKLVEKQAEKEFQPGEEKLEKLPRIVIIIDEMADLMQASPKEVEDAIARLAAMARAAGMHMVLATQRPSVDVITGTIKNNIPSRIAFAVSSQVDSRTILDEGGAEGLIGMGDMLFNPIGAPKPRRVQGCFVSDEEVESVVNFIKQNSTTDYDESVAQEIERNSSDNPDGGNVDMGDVDVLFNKAVEVCIEGGQASTAMLQRRLGIGYARAGRLIDQLEQRGVIGPFEGSKPRTVLMSRQQFLEMSSNNSQFTIHNSQSKDTNAHLVIDLTESDDDSSSYAGKKSEIRNPQSEFKDDDEFVPPVSTKDYDTLEDYDEADYISARSISGGAGHKPIQTLTYKSKTVSKINQAEPEEYDEEDDVPDNSQDDKDEDFEDEEDLNFEHPPF